MRGEIAKHLAYDPHFEWRGQTVTRIENLSDIVFALALGMLVSASSPPDTYQKLIPHLLNIVPITAGFLIMVLLWNQHFVFFRRYALADGRIIVLNGLLLLLILFVAYPLRFAFDSLFAFILINAGDPSRMEAMGISSYRQAGNIIALFYIGYGLAFLIYQAMYDHARNKASSLGLSENELQITRRSIWRFRVEIMVAMLVAPLAAFSILGPFAGALGILNWPGAVLIERWLPLAEPDDEAE